MILGSRRPLLRSSLGWLLGGWIVLGIGLLAWIVSRTSLPGAQFIAKGSSVLSWIGTIAVLAGLAALARTRARGGRVPLLALATFVWIASIALQMWDLTLPTLAAGDGVPLNEAADRLLPVRLLCATAAMIALANGLPRLLAGDDPIEVRTSWRLTGVLFALQLLAGAILCAVAIATGTGVLESFESFRSSLPDGVGSALVWIGFVVPWAHLGFSLRTTLGHYARRNSYSRGYAR